MPDSVVEIEKWPLLTADARLHNLAQSGKWLRPPLTAVHACVHLERSSVVAPSRGRLQHLDPCLQPGLGSLRLRHAASERVARRRQRRGQLLLLHSTCCGPSRSREALEARLCGRQSALQAAPLVQHARLYPVGARAQQRGAAPQLAACGVRRVGVRRKRLCREALRVESNAELLQLRLHGSGCAVSGTHVQLIELLLLRVSPPLALFELHKRERLWCVKWEGSTRAGGRRQGLHATARASSGRTTPVHLRCEVFAEHLKGF
jgi:hypothetical protein